MTGGFAQTGTYYVPLAAGVQAVYTINAGVSTLAYYRHADWLGSSRFGATPGGTVQYDRAYAPFGEPYVETATTDRSFTGQTQDTKTDTGVNGTTGLYDFLFREHSPAQGRWLVPDPAGLAAVDITNPQTWNRYAYVANNPLSSIDPLGLFTAVTRCEIEGNCDRQQLPSPEQFVSGSTGDNGDGVTPVSWDFGPPAATQSSGSQSSGTQASSSSDCKARSSGGAQTIVSGSVTTNTPTIAAGASIGGVLGGPPGAFVGGIVGSFFGVGGNVSYVPSTKSWYAGPTLVFGLGVGGGSGVSANVVNVPSGQNANSIAKGASFSLTYQPRPMLGSTVTKSPGSGPPVVGPSLGTRIPVSAGVSFNICLTKCGC